MNYLTKRIAFISGSTSGLGKELSIHLAKNGYHVLIHGRNQNKLNSLYDKIKSLNCLLYTSPSPRDRTRSRMPSSA